MLYVSQSLTKLAKLSKPSQDFAKLDQAIMSFVDPFQAGSSYYKFRQDLSIWSKPLRFRKVFTKLAQAITSFRQVLLSWPRVFDKLAQAIASFVKSC